jgi:hypothetical protein
MPGHSKNCPNCGDAVEYWQVNCRCGDFVGFPNYRAAAADYDELEKRERAARADATTRGLLPLLAKLEGLAEGSRPVIVMDFVVCDDILRSGKYRNYDKRVESGERNPAKATDHAERQMASERLFPTYAEHLHYAALSPDGRGLASYGTGAVAVRWDVTDAYLGRRASLLEENSYTFFDHHGLGARGAVIPLGYRAIWEERAKLAVAKLAARLTAATSEGSLGGLLLHAGATRSDDDFIERIPVSISWTSIWSPGSARRRRPRSGTGGSLLKRYARLAALQ